MTKGTRVGWLVVAGLTLLLSSCADDESLSPASTVMVEVTTEVSATPSGATSTTAAATTTTLPPVEDLLFVPESFRERLVELVVEVQLLRGLSFADPLEIEAITSQELERRLRARVEDDPSLSEADEPLFRLLGLIDPESDWESLLVGLRTRPTPGLYDVPSQKLWLVSTLVEPTPLEEMTLVGEISKALVDHNFDIWRRQDRLARTGDSDALTALRGIAEADSTLVELLFLEGLTDLAKKQVVEQVWELAADGPRSPPFVEHSMSFSSNAALDYLQRLYQLEGWDLVNDTHRDPPISTEHILARGVGRLDPVLLPKPRVSLPGGYREVADSVWGQWGWNALLASALDSGKSSSASWGWGGDRYLVFSNRVEIALVVDYIGDTVEDTEEMRAALQEYIEVAMNAGTSRRGETGFEYYADDYAWLSGEGEVLTFIAASDVEAGRRILASLTG